MMVNDRSKTRTMKIRLLRAFCFSLVLGLIAAVFLFVAQVPWSLFQAGGPIPFAFIWLPITGLSLFISIRWIRVASKSEGMVAALGFSCPIAILCCLLPMDHTLNFFAREMRIEACITVAGSLAFFLGLIEKDS